MQLDPILEKVGLFELFMFFWVIAFIVATEQMIMCQSVSLWYFQQKHSTKGGTELQEIEQEKNPEEEKKAEDAEGKSQETGKDATEGDKKVEKKKKDTSFMTDAVCITLGKHMGSLAMGSFIVAVVQTIRVCMELYIEQVTQLGGKTK